MVFFKAQKLQRLAELLQRVQKAIEGEGGDLALSEDELREVAGVAGLDLEIARMVDAATLESVLTAGGRDSGSRRWLAAEALFLDGLLSLGKGDETAASDRLDKARHLYLTLDSELGLPDGAVEPAERLRRIEEITPSGGGP